MNIARAFPFVILISFFALACKKDQRIVYGDELPPLTLKGANTFGCLVDGKVFVPKRDLFEAGVELKSWYQFVNSKYYFVIGGTDYDQQYSVVINVDNVQMYKDTLFSLNSPWVGPAYGRCGGIKAGFKYHYSTTPNHSGELKLLKFDLDSQIVSGTFWLDAFDSTTGKVVQIREGRFDARFDL